MQVDALHSSTNFIHGDIVLHPEMPDHAWSVNFADHGVHRITLVRES